ncbi:MAG: hypothetical protein COU90_01060 [Candidatus Ryanbacteria bacterium CG10_big_fil_rev_8_21_14_0_10_43_42]|uniref:Uncharacterized protein n=1 Tax=Candidatus Ryanbacteria bacterium CG10_big_fil_rev_8_21_14_0_10_43_42 TaxID=1974864 RepID=A0A2M8KY39_9BACT|nr:MAG: hypothetical protein COU90_01060 [Candidatus Ryanbacteria bacterium CG10_big_fil_rev_8_21_14_0_10_43_42]
MHIWYLGIGIIFGAILGIIIGGMAVFFYFSPRLRYSREARCRIEGDRNKVNKELVVTKTILATEEGEMQNLKIRECRLRWEVEFLRRRLLEVLEEAGLTFAFIHIAQLKDEIVLLRSGLLAEKTQKEDPKTDTVPIFVRENKRNGVALHSRAA